MGAALGTYAVWYTQIPEVGSPPGDWAISLTHFQFTKSQDYDCEIVRGNGYVAVKTATSCIIASPTISTDGVLEARIIVRRDLRFWDDT